MNEHNQHLETLTEIRALMEKSTRFLSLSGLSGVAAGTFALIGAALVYLYLDAGPFDGERYLENRHLQAGGPKKWGMDYYTFLIVDAAAVMICAVLSGFYFTWKKAKKKGEPLFNASAKRLALNLALPLATGGIFCLILLLKYKWVGIIAPATLIFYGLTLLNASKYTLDDIRYLGICEIILGLIATWYMGYGLLFWSIGFGVLHIVYGIYMYQKYER